MKLNKLTLKLALGLAALSLATQNLSALAVVKSDVSAQVENIFDGFFAKDGTRKWSEVCRDAVNFLQANKQALGAKLKGGVKRVEEIIATLTALASAKGRAGLEAIEARLSSFGDDIRIMLPNLWNKVQASKGNPVYLLRLCKRVK